MKKLIFVTVLSLLSLFCFSQQYDIKSIMSYNYETQEENIGSCSGQVEYKKWVGLLKIKTDLFCNSFYSSAISKTFIFRKLTMTRDTLGSRTYFYVAISQDNGKAYIVSTCYTDGNLESVGIRLDDVTVVLELITPIKQIEGG